MMSSGQRIRDYVLDSKIGEGGMGEIWRAHHQVLGRRVAIKAMAAHVATDPEFEERFVQEAKAQANLSHPRILGVNEFFIQDDVYYLVMPLVDGESLDARLERHHGPLPLDQTLDLARDLLDALDYAHQRGIIHRDVKPSNILIDADGRAYLMDFGIALLVGQDRKTRTGTSLGTPFYMSPEQIRQPRSIDHRTDVYSVGCVLYEALTGRPPFVPKEDGDTDFQVKEAHLYEHAEPVHAINPAVPEAVSNLIARAMVKEPTQRFAGCGEFLRALQAYQYQGVKPPTPLPSQAPRRPDLVPARQGPPPLPPTQEPAAAKRSPRALWFGFGVGTAGCLVVALILAFIVWAVREPPEAISVEAPPPSADEAVWSDTPEPFRTQLSRQLANIATLYTAEGFEKTHEFYVDRLEPGGQQSTPYTLEAGIDHMFVGFCDSDCSNVDFTLQDENDNEIDTDFATDDFPIVQVSPKWTGSFSLTVRMVECESVFCYYGVAVYGREAP